MTTPSIPRADGARQLGGPEDQGGLSIVRSRLAFLQEFERDLDSICLRNWFEEARHREPVLNEFIYPATLRAFLQTEERDPRKPQIWRALVRSFHLNPAPARLFVLGLLDPALGHLMNKFDGD